MLFVFPIFFHFLLLGIHSYFFQLIFLVMFVSGQASPLRKDCEGWGVGVGGFTITQKYKPPPWPLTVWIAKSKVLNILPLMDWLQNFLPPFPRVLIYFSPLSILIINFSQSISLVVINVLIFRANVTDYSSKVSSSSSSKL